VCLSGIGGQYRLGTPVRTGRLLVSKKAGMQGILTCSDTSSQAYGLHHMRGEQTGTGQDEPGIRSCAAPRPTRGCRGFSVGSPFALGRVSRQFAENDAANNRAAVKAKQSITQCTAPGHSLQPPRWAHRANNHWLTESVS
jgi:hypothetical protein